MLFVTSHNTINILVPFDGYVKISYTEFFLLHFCFEVMYHFAHALDICCMNLPHFNLSQADTVHMGNKFIQ